MRIQNEEERLAQEQRRIQMQADTEEVEAEVAMLREREDRILQLEVSNYLWEELTDLQKGGKILFCWGVEAGVATCMLSERVSATRDRLRGSTDSTAKLCSTLHWCYTEICKRHQILCFPVPLLNMLLNAEVFFQSNLAIMYVLLNLLGQELYDTKDIIIVEQE